MEQRKALIPGHPHGDECYRCPDCPLSRKSQIRNRKFTKCHLRAGSRAWRGRETGIASGSGDLYRAALPRSSSTAAVMAVTPVLKVGSMAGRNWLEWRAGRVLPLV